MFDTEYNKSNKTQRGNEKMKTNNHIQELYEEIRRCSKCNAPMIDGYCFDDGLMYACNDEHRDQICKEHYNTTWENLYDDEGPSYQTEWYAEYSSDELEKIIELMNIEFLGE